MLDNAATPGGVAELERITNERTGWVPDLGLLVDRTCAIVIELEFSGHSRRVHPSDFEGPRVREATSAESSPIDLLLAVAYCTSYHCFSEIDPHMRSTKIYMKNIVFYLNILGKPDI